MRRLKFIECTFLVSACALFLGAFVGATKFVQEEPRLILDKSDWECVQKRLYGKTLSCSIYARK